MKKILFLFAVVLAFASCEPKFEKEYSWAYPIAGDWVVTVYDKADSSYYYGPFELRGYNPSSGKDSIWFDDYPAFSYSTATELYTITAANFWAFKFKAAVNMTANTFQTTGSPNSLIGYATGEPVNVYEMDVVVNDGKIIGNDSIYMELTFSDDPTTFIISGHRATSYDDYMGNH